jgi:phosphatidylinositol alpha-1,6-mannosyltransferase
MAILRIVFACQSLREGNGGIARVDRLILELLAERTNLWEVEVHVFSDSFESNCGLPASLLGKVRYYGGSRLWFCVGLVRSFFRSGCWIYDAAYLAKIHPRVFQAYRPYMIFLHGIEIWEKAARGSIRACRGARLLVSNSNYTKWRAESCHGGFEQTHVCWLATEAGVDDGQVSFRDAKASVVLVVGRMDPREGYKGHDHLIRAWPDVIRAHPEAILEIVGMGGLLPELKRLAIRYGVERYIRFRGFVPENELADCYRRAAVFSLPSRGEGFGLVYIEAMRHALPVIASRHDAGAEIVQDGMTGLLADLDVPGDLAAKVIAMLDDPASARAMGAAGRRLWESQFRYRNFRARFTPLIEALVADAVPNVHATE